MVRDLLFVKLINAFPRPASNILGKAVQAMTAKNALNSAQEKLCGGVAVEVPGNLFRAKRIGFPEIEDFLFNLLRDVQFRVLRAGFGIDQRHLALGLIGPLQLIKYFSRNSEKTGMF